MTHTSEIQELDRTLVRLRRTVTRTIELLSPRDAAGKVDMAQLLACEAIADRSEAAMTVKDVAATLQLTHSTASRVLSSCEHAGLLTRSADPADRRRTLVALTDRGCQVVAAGEDVRRWTLAGLLADWEPQDLRTLSMLLARLEDHLLQRGPDLHEAALRRLRSLVTDAAPCRAPDPASTGPDCPVANAGGETGADHPPTVRTTT